MLKRGNSIISLLAGISIIYLVSCFLVYHFSKKGLSEFLRPTTCIDSDNPKIRKKTRELTRNCKNEMEKTRILFEFVRDSYTGNSCESFVASEILDCGGNLCRQRSILLAALCRAARIPARLHLQKVTVRNWKHPDGHVADITFAHGLTGIYLKGRWHLYEPVGNRDKWMAWTQDERRGSEMPVKFRPGRDCLFKSDEKIVIQTLPVSFADRTSEMVEMIEIIGTGR
jgi:hypothetical protein